MYVTNKFIRVLKLNTRSYILLCSILFIIMMIIFIKFQRIENADNLLHQYNYHQKTCQSFTSAKITQNYHKHNNNNESYEVDFDNDDDVWSNETVELFQDQLGIVLSDDNNEDSVENFNCHQSGKEFIMSSLPGAEEDNFYEALWQYFSLDALEHMTIVCDGKEKLTLKAFVTQRMKTQLEQIFVNLPLEIISNLPSSCFDLKYAKIIGNISPIELKEIALNTPFLLDPNIKRWPEIVQRWALKNRPFWRMKAEILNEVQQEFVVAKTILQIETSRDNDLNFIGVYVTSDDKLTPEYYLQAMNFHRKHGGSASIFMIICDTEIFTFCRDVFEQEKNPNVADTRLMRKSTDKFDFTLMANCNRTIVVNDMGVLHALINGGVAVVHKPELNDDPEFYIPWVIAQRMHNWHAIETNGIQ